MGQRLRVGFLGGIPPALGGGGLEIQMEKTSEALSALGHEVVRMQEAGRDATFDVLHAFGSEPDCWHVLRHWTRNRCPLVVSSIIVISPGLEERLLYLSARARGLLTTGRMRREVLARANRVIALTAYEKRILTSVFGVPEGKAMVLGNGVDRQALSAEPERPISIDRRPYVLLIGTISKRKGQAGVVRTLGRRLQVVAAGGFSGSAPELVNWEGLVAEYEATWLREVSDRAQIAALLRGALALVHLSSAEGESLAVLDALALGIPVVVSDIPSHRELSARYPDFVRLVSGPAELIQAINYLQNSPLTAAPPAVPSWEQVSERLASVYAGLLG